LVTLEQKFDVQIITQNIDDLHERAGSKNVLHLHGEITKCRTTAPLPKFYKYNKNIEVGDLGKDGYQLRPHIVWFGESVPMMNNAIKMISTAEIFLIIGTSLAVYPAAGLINYLPFNIPIYVVDKKMPPLPKLSKLTAIEQSATEGMKKVLKLLLA
jgi:NAD-dependent deacetylase